MTTWETVIGLEVHAQMTTKLWLSMIQDIKAQSQLPLIPFSIIQRINKLPKNKVDGYIASFMT